MLARCLVVAGAASFLSGCALPLLMAGPAVGVGGTMYARKSGLAYGQRVSDQTSAMPGATARAIGGQVSTSDIRIYRTEWGKHTSKWMAETPAGTYACSMPVSDAVVATCVKQ